MILNLGCIVEGHGDVWAVPVLLRRLQQEFDAALQLNIPRPIRTGRYKLMKPGELERAIQLAARQVKTPAAVLVLIDADDDCPKELAPKLLSRTETQRQHLNLPIGLVLAKYEFETWFLAAMESLGGRRGLADELQAVPNPETIRDPKRVLTRNMVGSRAYSETVDQPALAAVFDVNLARRRSASFDKCCRELERLLREASKQTPAPGAQSG